MKKITLILVVLSYCYTYSHAQMPIGGDTYYGNEWIDYEQQYVKINLAENGIYRIAYDELVQSGAFSGGVLPRGNQLQLFYMGQEVPLFASSTGQLDETDYIEFYGEKLDGWLDQFLYPNSEHQINPAYSLFTDTSAYFLTWREEASNIRYQNTINDLSNPPSKEAFCRYTSELVFKDRYENGQGSSEAISCRYDLAEGYTSPKSTRRNLDFSTPHIHTTNHQANLFLQLSTASRGTHDLAVVLEGDTLLNDNFFDWDLKKYTIDFNSDKLSSATNTISTLLQAEGGRLVVGMANLEYNRTFEFDDEDYATFTLTASNARQYLEINDFKHEGVAPILYDINNDIRIVPTIDNGVLKVVLPATEQAKKCILIGQQALKQVSKIEAVEMIPFDFEQGDYDYIILTHPLLFDDGNGVNYVQQYADYRASQLGGGYKPIIVDVTQLYDQFGYGIDRHEVSMRNFLKLASENWESEHLFILAKGMDKHKMRINPEQWQRFSLVPTFGFPHSDYLMVMDNDSSIPWMAVGRIAAYTPQQVKLYLDKVKEFENAGRNAPQTIKDKAWQKRVLHFGGGDIDIQNFIRNDLNRIKDTISQGQYGADVISFFKNSTDVLQDAPADEVEAYIENGAGMLTFFGHSAPNTLDFNIANPRVYQNKGKYPIFYAIGCNTNRVFDLESTLSEDYVLIKDQGAIAFFGSTWVTQLGLLSRYAGFLYSNLANEFYGEPIGTVIKESIKDFGTNSFFSVEQIRQVLMLHGDPALKIYPHAAPDYLVDVEKSNVYPDLVNLKSDSFQLNLTITNIGKAIADSINVRLEHLLPSGKLVPLQTLRLAAPAFELQQSITLPFLEKVGAIGRNQIVVTVDVDDEIVERPIAAEDNNQDRIPFFAISDDIEPVYPAEFSIVNVEDITLTASTNNAFSEVFQYYFEIDTTTNFNSSLKQDAIISDSGGVIEWTPNINWESERVYYWRVSIDSTSTNGKGFNWKNSSFTYILNGSEGWNQGHHYQYLADDFETLVIDSLTRAWKFGEFTRNVLIRASAFQNGVAPGGLDLLEVALFENGFRQFSATPGPCATPEQILLVEYDPVSLERDIYLPPLGETPNCKNKEINWYIFHPKKQEDRAKFIETIQNIESGRYVALFTAQRMNSDYGAHEWELDASVLGTDIFTVLEEQGARQVRALIDNQTPYIFIFKKDDPSFLPVERHATERGDIIEGSTDLKGINSKGSIRSTLIGPTQEWNRLEWSVGQQDKSDKVFVNVYGVKEDGTEDPLNLLVEERVVSLSYINADTYPYLRLEMVFEDEGFRTPTPINYWRVFYKPLLDLALAPNKHLVFNSDTLAQGDPLQLELAVANISAIKSDSLLMQYAIIDSRNNELKYLTRERPLQRKDSLIALFETSTSDLKGPHRLIVETSSIDGQKELNTFNNIGAKEFYVQSDRRNPLLDVTFDGVRIMNGDIVSAKPEIMIYLRDENKFLALNDTSLMEVKVVFPSGEVRAFNFDHPDVNFYPPTQAELETRNEARVSLRHEFPENGTYQLQVQAEDRSGNDAGDYMYTVDFEIIRENRISNVLNYPNPFSTSTQFVFTLTGEEVPQDLKIQIMTVSGQVIREIDAAELGALRIGRNISEFRWDGTDQFGDKLANGVYLYRVMIRDANGEAYEKFDTQTDQYFFQNIGKMVILR